MGELGNDIHILLVEDDEVDIQNVEREFKKINELISISAVKNGIEALDKLYGRNGEEKMDPVPNVILLDINMPKMNGIQFLKTLRSDASFSHINVFLLTGSYTTSDKLATHALNVSGCIIKPLQHADALQVFWALVAGNN